MQSIFKNSIIIAALLFGAASVSNAQVKVGANPAAIGTNSNLEVEAANGSKTVVTKDSSKVGIGTDSPTNKLHVVNYMLSDQQIQFVWKVFSRVGMPIIYLE